MRARLSLSVVVVSAVLLREEASALFSPADFVCPYLSSVLGRNGSAFQPHVNVTKATVTVLPLAGNASDQNLPTAIQPISTKTWSEYLFGRKDEAVSPPPVTQGYQLYTEATVNVKDSNEEHGHSSNSALENRIQPTVSQLNDSNGWFEYLFGSNNGTVSTQPVTQGYSLATEATVTTTIIAEELGSSKYSGQENYIQPTARQMHDTKSWFMYLFGSSDVTASHLLRSEEPTSVKHGFQFTTVVSAIVTHKYEEIGVSNNTDQQSQPVTQAHPLNTSQSPNNDTQLEPTTSPGRLNKLFHWLGTIMAGDRNYFNQTTTTSTQKIYASGPYSYHQY